MRILFKPLLWIWIMILTSNYKNKEWVLNSLFMMYYLAKLPKEITKKHFGNQALLPLQEESEVRETAKRLQVQYHQLCECRVQPEGEPDTGEVYPKPCRSQRNGGNAVGILAKRQERGRWRQRPVLPDIRRELPCRLHLFLREL